MRLLIHSNLSIELLQKESWLIVWPHVKDTLWSQFQAPLPFTAVCVYVCARADVLAQVRYYLLDKKIYFTHYKFLPEQRTNLLKCCKFGRLGPG